MVDHLITPRKLILIFPPLEQGRAHAGRRAHRSEVAPAAVRGGTPAASPPSLTGSAPRVWWSARAPCATAPWPLGATSRWGSTPHSSIVTAAITSGDRPGSA